MIDILRIFPVPSLSLTIGMITCCANITIAIGIASTAIPIPVAMVTIILRSQSFTTIAVAQIMIIVKTGSFVSTTSVAILVTITCVVLKVIITIGKVIKRCSNWFLHGRR